MKSSNHNLAYRQSKSPTKNKFFIIVCFIILSSFISISLQADILDYLESREITIIIGETKPLSVNNPQRVKIGNPDLLDVVSAGKKELLLSGLAAGETELTIVDDFGKHIYTVKIFTQDLKKLKERIDILLKAVGFDGLSTQIGDKERKVFILGQLPMSKKDALENKLELVKDRIVNLVEFFEDVPTVEVDVEVLEIAKTDLDTLGFSWNQTIAFNEPSGADNFPNEILNPKHTLKILKTWRATSLAATLNLLKQDNKVRTLSRPKLVCLSGKEAKLLVGGERPIIVGSTTTTDGGSSTTSYDIELKEYGIALNVKPTVKGSDVIQVSLNVEITEIDDANVLALSGEISTPGFTERSAQTELSVLSGQTVFLAGLIKSVDSDLRTEVPFLGRIPILGLLFRKKDLDQRDTEIVITLTPTIIRNRPPLATTTKVVVDTSKKQEDTFEIKVVESQETYLLDQEDPIVKYSSLVQNIINSNIEYPEELRDEGVKGTVKLSLHLLPTGKLLGVIIMKSSGSDLLDDSAEFAVKKLSPFPVFPSSVKLKELWIDIPIVYEVEEYL